MEIPQCSVSFSGLAWVWVPLPKCHPARARNDAQRPSEGPHGWHAVKEYELEDERQQHVQGPHQGHGSSLLDLQGFGEEGLAGDAQNSNQHQHPAIAAAGRQLPLPEDGYGDDALGEADDGVIPDGEVVVGALPDLAKDDDRACGCDGSCPYKCSNYMWDRRQAQPRYCLVTPETLQNSPPLLALLLRKCLLKHTLPVTHWYFLW